ncbi:hypothetical protein FSP39_016947 [Pinctada imbricata]|uniref:HMG box domain-containing protein n=1 Tax=Pinctada imbricata TaxID=66713 RepID=A0AA89CAZ5_PINIB|nr:hypothetical protein FSP39_016947 [Pinctada imbricata]
MGKAKRKIDMDTELSQNDGASAKKKKKKHSESGIVPDSLTNSHTSEHAEKKKKKKKKRNKEKSKDKVFTEHPVTEDTSHMAPSGDSNRESQDEGKSSESEPWKIEDTLRLVHYFLTLPAVSDNGLSHSTLQKDIDWNAVHIEGMSTEDCKQKFKFLSYRAKQMMTIGELCPLINRVLEEPVVQRHHGIKVPTKAAKKEPVLKMKTLTPQQMYTDSMVAKELQENPQLDVKEIKAKKEFFRKKWYTLKDSKKVKWIQKAMQDQEDASKKILVTKAEKKLSEKASGAPVAPPGSAYSLFCKMLMPELTEYKGTEKFTICGQRWKALSDEENKKYHTEHSKLQEEYKRKYQEYLSTLTEEQRQALAVKNKPKPKASVSKTPKKSSNAPGLTKEMYAQVVKPEIQHDHPEMSEADILHKITRDFMKLTPEEKIKYETLHIQINQKRITDFFRNGQTESTPKHKKDNVKKKMTIPQIKEKVTSPRKSSSAVKSKKDSDSSSSEESSEDETNVKKNSPKKAPSGSTSKQRPKPDSSSSDSDSD